MVRYEPEEPAGVSGARTEWGADRNASVRPSALEITSRGLSIRPAKHRAARPRDFTLRFTKNNYFCRTLTTLSVTIHRNAQKKYRPKSPIKLRMIREL